MGTLERILQSIFFEVLAVSLSIMGLALFTNHDLSALSGTMIVVASIAMLWNYFFNYFFDQVVTGDKDKRSFSLRIVHVVLFEAGLLIATVPVMAYILNVGLWDAFMMDLGVTIFITIYAFVFNFSYDKLRVIVIKNRALKLSSAL